MKRRYQLAGLAGSVCEVASRMAVRGAVFVIEGLCFACGQRLTAVVADDPRFGRIRWLGLRCCGSHALVGGFSLHRICQSLSVSRSRSIATIAHCEPSASCIAACVACFGCFCAKISASFSAAGIVGYCKRSCASASSIRGCFACGMSRGHGPPTGWSPMSSPQTPHGNICALNVTSHQAHHKPVATARGSEGTQRVTRVPHWRALGYE